MRCSHCHTTNRALYRHPMADGSVLDLCDLCLRAREAAMQQQLQVAIEREAARHHCRLRPRLLDGKWRLFTPATRP